MEKDTTKTETIGMSSNFHQLTRPLPSNYQNIIQARNRSENLQK